MLDEPSFMRRKKFLHVKREPVNIHNTYLISVQGLVQNNYCGCPELLNDCKQLDEVFVISRIIKVEVGYKI